MKQLKMVVPVVASLALSSYAWIPSFSAGLGEDTLKVNGIAIADHNDSITFPSPVFADWDGDGLDDMILGYWHSYIIKAGQGGGEGAKVRFYKNNGTKGAPDFADMGDLTAGGSDIKLEAA